MLALKSPTTGLTQAELEANVTRLAGIVADAKKAEQSANDRVAELERALAATPASPAAAKAEAARVLGIAKAAAAFAKAARVKAEEAEEEAQRKAETRVRERRERPTVVPEVRIKIELPEVRIDGGRAP